jgi:hypothetical protein
LVLRIYTLSHSTRPFLWRFFFEITSRGPIFLDWLWTSILLISAFWVAGITGVSHQLPASYFLKKELWIATPSIFFIS